MAVQNGLEPILAQSSIIPVINIASAEDALPLIDALYEGGMRVFEITLRTSGSLQALKQVCQHRPNLLVGAGSVLDARQFDAAVEAGAAFLVSPGATDALIAHAARNSQPWLPGAASASEMMRLHAAGYSAIKYFPAEANGGIKSLRALAAPLGNLRFCPTGGINENNLHDYLSEPFVACVGGSWMLRPDDVAAQNWQSIAQATRDALALADSLKN